MPVEMRLATPERDGYGSNKSDVFEASPMAQLTVRKLSDEVVGALKLGAAANGRSAESEHREILRATLLEANQDFAGWAASAKAAFDC